MPFDGNSYGKIALIAPIEYHPEAPSVPGVVSKSLAGAYSYSRSCSAKRIGDQTYRVFSRDPRVYGTTAWTASLSFEDIAEFGTRFIPGHATHIVARADLLVAGTSGISTANMRVVAVATGTDTGATTQLSIDLSNYVQVGNTLGVNPTPMEAEVALANITQDGQVTVTVQAFITDDAGAKTRPYGVAYVVAWWEARD